MKDFKKFCLFAMVLLVALLMIGVNESFAGPLGLFPNFHPLQRVGNGVRAVGRGAGNVVRGTGRVVTGRGRGSCGAGGSCASGSCANGVCQVPAGKPVQGPAQAPVQKK